MSLDEPPPSPSLIAFRYVWTVRVNERELGDGEKVSCFLLVLEPRRFRSTRNPTLLNSEKVESASLAVTLLTERENII